MNGSLLCTCLFSGWLKQHLYFSAYYSLPTLSTELSGTSAPGLTNCSSTLGSGFLGRERSSVPIGVIGSPDPDSGSWDNGGLKCVFFWLNYL